MFRFTIDNWVNKYLWPNKVSKLPQPFRQVLGGHTTAPVGDHFIWLEVFISSFCGVALLEGVFEHSSVFNLHHLHNIIASYGATAILCFNVHQSPLAQPRNVLVGHFVASVIGVGVQKLFLLSEAGRSHYWASGALSLAILSVLMSILNCVHPPAGASALLPSIDDRIREISWWYLPAQLVSSVLMISVALITGNVIRQYPLYWWSPNDLGKKRHPKSAEAEGSEQILEEESLVGDFEITRIKGFGRIEITLSSVMIPEELNVEVIDMEWLSKARKLLLTLEAAAA